MKSSTVIIGLKAQKKKFRDEARVLKDRIEEMRSQFEMTCLSEAQASSDIEEIYAILDLVYKNTEVATHLIERLTNLSGTQAELLRLVIKSSQHHWRPSWYVAIEKIVAYTISALRSIRSKADAEAQFIVLITLHESGVYYTPRYCGVKRDLIKLFSERAIRYCMNLDDLEKMRKCLDPDIYWSRRRMLYKEKYGHIPRPRQVSWF